MRTATGYWGAVASESQICSDVGVSMLKSGGNAADATVATVLCVGVVGMYHCGIGGGGFMLIRTPGGSFESIDFRETAPALAREDMFVNDPMSSRKGGLASGVPGELRGLQYLHETYGSLPWKDVVQPAVDIARTGFKVNQDFARNMNAIVAFSGRDFFVEDPIWATEFAPNGKRLCVGDIMYRLRLANTLEKIGEEGPQSFYEGELARSLINTNQAFGGVMTLQDLESYEVKKRTVHRTIYRGYRVATCSAPTSGAVTLSALQTVSCYNDFFGNNLADISTHRLVEAFRFAYGQRTKLGDPSFVNDLEKYEKHMYDADSAAFHRSKISDQHTLNIGEYIPSNVDIKEDHGTSHLVAADSSGLAISLTTTVNIIFGSQVMVPDSGVIMNNVMEDFSYPGRITSSGYEKAPKNRLEPGKRPLSSATPIIVEYEDGSFCTALGAAGGSRIITASTQALVNLLDRDMTLSEAIAEPRLHNQVLPNETSMEPSFDPSLRKFLESRQHKVTRALARQSRVYCVRRLPDGLFQATGDPQELASGGSAI